MRTGPDLSNIGVRNPSEQWHYLHLYNPQITSPGSIMPPFPFLFETRPIDPTVGATPDALQLRDSYAPLEGQEVVPTDDARALVAYLKSLKLSTQNVPEAKDAARETRSWPPK